MIMRNSAAIITAVETALTGRMMATGVRMIAKIRSSRNEGSCRQAAEKPSRANATELKKFRKFRRLAGGGLADGVTAGQARQPAIGEGSLKLAEDEGPAFHGCHCEERSDEAIP